MSLSILQQQWIQRFTVWAESRNDVRAALVVGSHGRTNNHPADEWSDVDVLFITTKPRSYTENNAWMHEIGSLWTGVMSPEETFGGLWPVFCGFSVYEDGLTVDFFILSNARTEWMTRVVRLLDRYPGLRRRLPDSIASLGAEVGEFFHLGVRVLLDKDGLVERLRQAILAVPVTSPPPPSQQAFQHDIDDFWIGPPKVAANLRRGQLMAAMRTLESGKRRLLKWIEWHARAKSGWKEDGILYIPKWIDRWADPRALEVLPRIYARYDADEMWLALLEMMDLYCWLTAETADLLGYDCSFDAAPRVTAWVKQCFTERDS
jgi:aminoglycoside 6-adenylyltransferase